MTAACGPFRTVSCAPQESPPVYSGHCAFPKRAADAAIGRYPYVTSTPSDTPQNFIRSLFLFFREHSRGDLPFFQEVNGRPGGGSRWSPIWKIACPYSTRDLKFNRPTIWPRGTYWSRFSRHLQSGRRNFPCQESWAGGWWWHGTIPI